MSKCKDAAVSTEPTQDDQAEASIPLLDYGCTPWRISSQRVADLYNSGTKLWTKEDLVDIERQLEQSTSLDRFTVRSVNDEEVQMKNPLFGVQAPIRKPFVRYQEYWKLIHGKFDGPSGTNYCSYIVDWESFADRDFRGNVNDWEALFETKSRLWNASATCDSFRQEFRKLLATRRVTKIACFGLGDIARKAPAVIIFPNNEGYKYQEPQADASDLYPGIMQHAAAMTMAEEAARVGGKPVRLMSQDPKYSDDAKAFLSAKGFEIVGSFGAGGFTEVDGETVVFSAWTNAPVKQIIADIARPAAFMLPANNGNFLNRFGNPFADPETPRTKQMRREYETWTFPTSAAEADTIHGLQNLEILVKKAEDVPGESSG